MVQRWHYAWRRIGKLVIALICTVVLINLVYGFEGTGRRLGDFEFLSTSLGGSHDSRFETGNRYRGTLLGWVPVPLPCEMLQGMDYLRWEFERGMPCYLLGEWKFRGWWYYYLVAVLFLAQVSSQTGFTHHLRYVLPAFGFLYILGARSISVLPRRFASILVGLCLVGTIVFHLTHIGQVHTHFNTLAGGPTNGWRHLSLSNVDWGQSTFRMADWARAHPEKRPLTVVFVSELGSPSNLISDLGIPTRVNWQDSKVDERTRLPMPGWYLMSSEQLTHEQNIYFRNREPQSWPFVDVALFFVPDGGNPEH